MLWTRMLKDNKKNWRRVYKVCYTAVCRCIHVVSALCGRAHVSIVLSGFVQAEPCACMTEPVRRSDFK